MFITFEGIDGSGKTTQSKLLAHYLMQNHDVILTREPGGTEFGEKIREILLASNVNPISELLLLISIRHEHMNKLILPSIAEGKIIICDRFIDSTIAYQGYGLGVDLKLINLLHQSIKIEYPEITFILDIDTDVGLNRVQDKNRYEEMDMDFYNRVRDGFRKIAEQEPHRCHIINESTLCGRREIHGEIIKKLNQLRSL